VSFFVIRVKGPFVYCSKDYRFNFIYSNLALEAVNNSFWNEKKQSEIKKIDIAYLMSVFKTMKINTNYKVLMFLIANTYFQFNDVGILRNMTYKAK